MPIWRRWPAGRVDHVDNVDHRPTGASRPCVDRVDNVDHRPASESRPCVRGFVDNVDHVDHELQVVDPPLRAGWQRRCSHYCMDIQYMIFISL